MTHKQKTYRGLPIPTPEEDRGIWYIADDEIGWFDGHSKHGVTEKWRVRVDYVLTRKAVESGDYTVIGEYYGCLRCGALVFEPLLHQETLHVRVDKGPVE